MVDQETVEKMWRDLEDVPFDEDKNKELILAENFYDFEKGTEREEIWYWFDENHPKGVAYLLNEYEIS